MLDFFKLAVTMNRDGNDCAMQNINSPARGATSELFSNSDEPGQ
jgi:hypothetical protein